MRQYKVLHWLRENYPEGIIDWETIDHPGFPEKQIEIGGFEPFVMNTPPVSEIDDIRQKATDLLYKQLLFYRSWRLISLRWRATVAMSLKYLLP